ncbi:MAG: histidine kinase [Anaerocolumna sp.]|jgi:two-component system sensor histidine kinase KdpD|nr:histidine kinase [Anaerocolumna sp.]
MTDSKLSLYNGINANTNKGHLKIYFGYAKGVGKTYAMLDDAREQMKRGVDVLVGFIESHSNSDTMNLLHELPLLPYKVIEFSNSKIYEFDLDSALSRKPSLIILDDLAHINANGVRNKKRYQDIEELLNVGIDVYTTINVEQLESLQDVIQEITKIKVKETVPDSIFDIADKVVLVDIEPDELINRININKDKYVSNSNTVLGENFTKDDLKLLREIAMRKATDRIRHVNQTDVKTASNKVNMKLMVCISSSPTCAKSIRWTARTADAFHANWVVVYIENKDSIYLKEEQKMTLQANMELAEQLGAEIITLNGLDIASTIVEYAKLSGITNIVIGKSRNKKNIFNLFNMDLEDQLISLLPNVEIHIIPNENVFKPYRVHKSKKIGIHTTFSWKYVFIMVAILTCATLVSMLLQLIQTESPNIILVYILSVLIIARYTTGYIYSIISSFLSVVLFNYIFSEPFFSFTSFEQSDSLTFIMMFVVALITSAMTIRMKAHAKFAVDREKRTELLYEINKKLLITRGLDNIIELTNDYIVKIFDRSTCFFSSDPINGFNGKMVQAKGEPNASFMTSSKECQVAHWVFVNQKKAGAGTDTLADANAFYMPVLSQGNVLAVIGLSCAIKPLLTQNNRLFLRMIASLVALAIERQRLSDEQNLILVATEKEKMRGNLLRAISHDLRTPLTGIIGASSTILENEGLNKQTKNQLLSNIKDEAQWLIRTVENILSVTRINEESTEVIKTPEAAEEIVAESISRIRKRYKDKKINAKIPDEILLVPMDGTLIVQVLINLIENAIKYSGQDSIISVVLRRDEDMAVFEVMDNGLGIPEHMLPNLFNHDILHGKSTIDATRGMGIGLSICKSIINAHQGKIEAENKQGEGALIRFALPLDGGKCDD